MVRWITRARGARMWGLLALAAGAMAATPAHSGKKIAQPKGLAGRIVLQGKAPSPEMIPIGVDVSVCGKSKAREALLVSKSGGVAHAVVSLVNPPAGARALLPTQLAVGQGSCTFSPHVVLVPKGGTVKFTNADPIMHNVRIFSASESMNRAATQNFTIEKTFTSPGPHPVRCDFHPWMKGFVFVADHPYYAVTDEEGRFSFDVPPGKYEVRVWHETLGQLKGTLEVGKSGELTYPASAAVVPPLGAEAASDWQ